MAGTRIIKKDKNKMKEVASVRFHFFFSIK